MLPSELPRSVLIKAEDTTNPDFGCEPKKRPIDEYINKGIINLDKPAGPTSHEVASWVKKILGLKKAGHSGTLDPNVTGLLPIMLGEATRLGDALLTAGKEYICLMRLHQKIPGEKIQEVFKEFIGPIYQKPSLKSAVKRETRIRNIYYLDILELEEEYVLFKVGCEAGTYIRKLCHDLGLALGTGAHMQELRRTKTGGFREDETTTNLHSLKDAQVIWEETKDETYLRKIISPMEKGLLHLPKIVIRDSAVDAICHGASLAAPGILTLETGIQKGSMVAVFTLKGEAASFGTAQLSSEEIMELETGIAATTERVLMEPGTYPKGWKPKK